MKQIFEFDEEMMTICLLANGWTGGWSTGRWLPQDAHAEHCGYTLREAFERLLLKNNLYSRSFNHGWKLK